MPGGAPSDPEQDLVAAIAGARPAAANSLLGVLSEFLQHRDPTVLAHKAHEVLESVDPPLDQARALIRILHGRAGPSPTGSAVPPPAEAQSTALGFLMNVVENPAPLWVGALDRRTVACQLACQAIDTRLVESTLGQPVIPNTAKWIVDRFAKQDFSAYIMTVWNLVGDADANAAGQHAVVAGIRIREWMQPIAVTVGVTTPRDAAPVSNTGDVIPAQARLNALDFLLAAIRRSPGGLSCILVQAQSGIAHFRDGVTKETVMQRLRDAGYRAVSYQRMMTPNSHQRVLAGENDGPMMVRLAHLRTAKACLDRGAAVIGLFNCDYASEAVRKRLDSGASAMAADFAHSMKYLASPNAARSGPHVVIFQSLSVHRTEVDAAFVVPHTGERVSVFMHTGAWLSEMIGYVTAQP